MTDYEEICTPIEVREPRGGRPLSWLEYRMLEKPAELGAFEVTDDHGKRMGSMKFRRVTEEVVEASSSWGRLELVSDKKHKQTRITLDGKPLVEAETSTVASRLILHLATRGDLIFKHSILGNSFRSQGELGTVVYDYEMRILESERGACTIKIGNLVSMSPEPIALSLMALYGLQRLTMIELQKTMQDGAVIGRLRRQ